MHFVISCTTGYQNFEIAESSTVVSIKCVNCGLDTNAAGLAAGIFAQLYSLLKSRIWRLKLSPFTRRHFSLRDLFKLCSRLSKLYGPPLARALRTSALPSGAFDLSKVDIKVREAGFIECADCFCGMITKPDAKRKLLSAFCSLWALPGQYVEHYESLHKPAIQEGSTDVQVGRVALPVLNLETKTPAIVNRKARFARTGVLLLT